MPPTFTLMLLTLFGAALLAYRRALSAQHRGYAALAWFSALISAVAVVLYRPEDFHYPVVLILQLAERDDFVLHVNGAKALAGMVMLWLLIPLQLKERRLLNDNRHSAALFLILLLLVLGLAALIFELAWVPKPLSAVLIFACVNLVVTCVAEEGFTRLLIHNESLRITYAVGWPRWGCEVFALSMSAALFTLLHFPPSFDVLLITAAAGLAYGAVYTVTKNVFWSIGLHFGVNLVHFSLLTYPLP